MYKIFFGKDEKNDATHFYVNIIKKHLEFSKKQVDVIYSLKDIQKKDKIIVISAKMFFFIWLKNPKQHISIWFQGVVPEEAFFAFSHTFISKYIRKLYNEIWEKIALKYAKNIFFVSKAMLNHYQKKYKYQKNNYFIMPCFNQKLNKDAFKSEKYLFPTFLYAGTLSKWQCIDKTLMIFKKIQDQIPTSTLFLYTAEKEKAKNMVEKYNIKNAIIDYVSYEELNEKIKDIKYGFLIREDNIINNVATPTKMNGYLANGIIPIYFDVIEDFRENLKNQYIITGETMEEIINKTILFEKKKLNSYEIYNQYKIFFEKYYNEEFYIKNIKFL